MIYTYDNDQLFTVVSSWSDWVATSLGNNNNV